MNDGAKDEYAYQNSRKSGILCSLTSLPTPYGIGDMGPASYAFIDWLVASGQKQWEILPLNPTGFGNSPYQSFSAFAGNPYLISPQVLIEKHLLTETEVNSFCFGDKDEDVDYGKLFLCRIQLLRLAFVQFKNRRMDESSDYKQFCTFHSDWLTDYAAFMTIKEQCGYLPWTQWDARLAHRVEPDFSKFLSTHKEALEFWYFVQYEFFCQWNALHIYALQKGIEMIGDMPFYVAADSADVWSHRQLFAVDETTGEVRIWAGVPSDCFADYVRNWGNPVYNWATHHAENYAWFRRRIAICGKMYEILRLDHVIALMRYFGIPDGTNAGIWYDGPDAKAKCLSLAIQQEADQAGLKMIAEDLGKVPPGMRAMLSELGWAGMRVLQLAFTGKYKARNHHLPMYYTPNMIVYTGTHDNPTMEDFISKKNRNDLWYIGYWTKKSEKKHMRWALIEEAYKSVANQVMIPLQDVLGLGEEARMAWGDAYDRSWRWRLSSLDLLSPALSLRLKRLAILTGRFPMSEDEFEMYRTDANGGEDERGEA